MTHINITADIGGHVFVARIETELEWIPVEVGTQVRRGRLPHCINSIEMADDQACFYQNTQPPADPEPKWWRRFRFIGQSIE